MDNPPACRLIPGTHGLLIQSSLMVIAFVTLLAKKRWEDSNLGAKKGRSWSEFFLDSSKQIIGAGWVHILNILLSVRLKRKTELGDSCDWYFANIFVDCTIGTFLEFILFVIVMYGVIPYLFSEKEAKEFKPGQYKNIQTYLKQLSIWLIVVTAMKLVVYGILKTYRESILEWSDMCLDRFRDEPERKLFVVMVVTPLVMNTMQLWIIDNFIKTRHSSKDTLSEPFIIS